MVRLAQMSPLGRLAQANALSYLVTIGLLEAGVGLDVLAREGIDIHRCTDRVEVSLRSTTHPRLPGLGRGFLQLRSPTTELLLRFRNEGLL